MGSRRVGVADGQLHADEAAAWQNENALPFGGQSTWPPIDMESAADDCLASDHERDGINADPGLDPYTDASLRDFANEFLA